MNYYFLIEDEKSFCKILPTWLNFMDFGCTQVENCKCLTYNTYVIDSGKGIERLVSEGIERAIRTIKQSLCKVDKLIIIVDAEEKSVDERKNVISNKINNIYSQKEIPCSINIFVCNRCIETWLLGCIGIFPSSDKFVSKDFAKFYNFYDIENNDPEKMLKPLDYNSSIASYHFQYLHTLTQDISKERKLKDFTYHKNKNNCAFYKEYFDSIVNRISKTNDIKTFQEFYDFIVAEREYNK